MTKPLSKVEKAQRAKVRKMTRDLVAKDKAEGNAKKKAGGLSRSERADMIAAVAYIKQTNYSSADDVCKNVKRLRTYSRACEAIANAVERDLICGQLHKGARGHEKQRYWPTGGKKKTPATATEKAKKVMTMIRGAVPPHPNRDDAGDLEHVLKFIENRSFASVYMMVGSYPDGIGGLARHNDFQRSFSLGLRLGWLRKNGDYYYPISKKEWEKFQAMKAAKRKAKEKAPLGSIPEIVDYIKEEGPFSMKEMRECAPNADNDATYREAEEAVKLGWLRKDKNGVYSLVRKVPKKKATAKAEKASTKAAQFLQLEEELADCRDELKDADQTSQVRHRQILELKGASHRSDGIFTARIVGLGLRALIQEATLSSERHDFAVLCGRLRDLTEIVRTELKAVSTVFVDARMAELGINPEAREVDNVWQRWRADREDTLIHVYSDLKVLIDEFDPPGHWREAGRAGELTTAAVASILGQPDVVVSSARADKKEKR